MKTLIHNKHGFSLVEILVAFFIISLLAMAVIPALTYGFLQIDDSGDKSKALASVQQSVETELAKSTVPKTHTVTVKFGSTNVSIDGVIIQKEESYGNFSNKVKVDVFIPNK
jgi:prepilin-type N-terminal cleavage/methylation domain-containing protein